jgi:hypothetical protein
MLEVKVLIIFSACKDFRDAWIDVTTIVFSYFKLNPYTQIAKEREQTNYSFIYLYGGDLRPLNHEVIPACRVFRHAGIDVNLFYCAFNSLINSSLL